MNLKMKKPAKRIKTIMNERKTSQPSAFFKSESLMMMQGIQDSRVADRNDFRGFGCKTLHYAPSTKATHPNKAEQSP